MPAATQYAISDDGELRKREEAAREAFAARRETLKTNQDYYKGRHKPQLKVTGKYDDNVTLNLCRMAVDRTASFLFPEPPVFELDLAENTEDEDWLKAAWENSGGATLMGNLFLNGATAGQVYARLLPPKRPGDFPDVINMNPANVITWWHEDDPRKVLWFEIQTKLDEMGAQAGLDLANYKQDIVAVFDTAGEVIDWDIYEYRRDGSRWASLGPPVPWSSPLGPIVEWAHLPRPNAHGGEHEFGHAALNDAVNKVASDINRILRFHAFPKPIITGARVAEVKEVGIDGMLSIENPDAKVINVEMQSDLTASMNYLDQLRDAFFVQSRVVILKGGLDAFRSMTNLGIKAAFMDMIAKNETLRRQYGDGLAAISERLLMLGDKQIVRPQVVWSDALPVDAAGEFALIDQMHRGGYISMETARGRLGIDHAAEETKVINDAIGRDILRDGLPVGVSG